MLLIATALLVTAPVIAVDLVGVHDLAVKNDVDTESYGLKLRLDARGRISFGMILFHPKSSLSHPA